jgi:putative ABC transport system permease protein
MRFAKMAGMRLRALFRRNRVEEDLNEELRYHVERDTEENARAGMTHEAARLQAIRSLEGIERRKEECRDTRGTRWLERLATDFLYGWRQLLKQKMFSAVPVLTLALGIGATTAIYSVAKAVVFAPLPLPEPDRVVQIFQGFQNTRYEAGSENRGMMAVRNGLFQDWRERSRYSFQNMAAYQTRQLILRSGDRTEVVDSFLAGDGFFETLGVPARTGRVFNATDYSEGARVVVLADRFWRAEYGADPTIVGREIVLDGAAYRVVGVMPTGFLPTRWERDPELWLPLNWDPATKYSRTLWSNLVYARLKPGVTLGQAQAEMDSVDRQLRTVYPEESADSVVVPLDGYLFGHYERMFKLLLMAAALLLLIACANVANLLLARALQRRREFALRSALGASRVAILQQMLAESLAIAGAGGLLGVVFSLALIRPVVALLPATSKIPRLDQIRLDGDVLLFTLLVSTGCGLVFGILPALRASRGDLAPAIKSGGRGGSRVRHEGRWNDLLVAVEFALSLLLLVCGSLVTRAFLQLVHTDPGFRPAHAVALQLAIPPYRYPVPAKPSEDGARRQLYDRMQAVAQSIPEVEYAAISRRLPFRQGWNPEGISIEGRPQLATAPGELPRITKALGWPIHGEMSFQTVSPGYFEALGVPLLRGRFLDSRDRPDAPIAVVINQAAALKFFPKEDPIGKRIANDGGPMTIVGIVGDPRLDGIDTPVLPEGFRPISFEPSPNAWLIVRTRVDAASIGNALRQAVHNVNGEIGVTELSTMSEVVNDSLWRERFSAVLIGLFATFAVVIASAGVYAVISHAVERRTHELGVRVALGASGLDIAWSVLGHSLRVSAMGTGLGLLLTSTVVRFVPQASCSPGDLAMLFIPAAGLLAVLAVIACAVPVRRARSIDPAVTLRLE